MPGDGVFPDEVTKGPIHDGDDAVQDHDPCRHVLDKDGHCRKCGENFGEEIFKS